MSSPLRSREGLLDAVRASLGDRRWGFQGPVEAVPAWLGTSGFADLDIWVPDRDAGRAVADALKSWAGALIADADDPSRLRHMSWAVETEQGLAVVDLTIGDLRVGPVLLVPERVVLTAEGPHGPVLEGVAGAADKFVRPLLRGRVVVGARLDQARRDWAQAPELMRTGLARALRIQLGATLASHVVAALEGADPDPGLARRARVALLRATARPASIPSAIRQRASILPGAQGPAGLTATGAVVALVGTDGAGKSTVAGELRERLDRIGVGVDQAYFGMARGNLPGVGVARRLLGIASVPAEAPVAVTKAAVTKAGPEAHTPPDEPDDGDLSHPVLRKAAAWVYAVEYGWRYVRLVAPARRRGRVVLCDRWITDLRESPWPGSPASRFAEAVIPAPDVLLLPDAPIEEIHARKPERSLSSQNAQQSRFRALLGEMSAGGRTAAITVNTSVSKPADEDPLAPVVSAVVAAMHRRHRHSG